MILVFLIAFLIDPEGEMLDLVRYHNEVYISSSV